MKLQIVFVVLGLAGTSFAAHVEPQIFKNLEKSETTNVLVTFKKAETKKLGAAFDALNLKTTTARRNTLHAMYKDHADTIQVDVISMLDKLDAGKRHYYSQLWISAELIVREVDKETIELLKNHPDVKSLVAEVFYPLEYDVEQKDFQLNNESTLEIQWGVSAIRAPTVWTSGNRGEGVVIAAIDTGVRWTHVDLQPTYRGTATGSHNYNWYAPTGQAAVPFDEVGHGTHVTGSHSGTGSNGIGVAPGSQWIHCRGCAGFGCSNFDLLQCGNWVACPTNTAGGSPDCSRAPDICNNSWGGTARGNPWYDEIIVTWIRENIVPIFSAGNSFGCNTVASPADRPNVIAIGSINSDKQISFMSSGGPTIDGRHSPQVSAPGDNIISASHESDTGYTTMFGTSMAAPHVAGVAGLMRSRNRVASVEQIRDALINSSVAITPSGITCFGTPDSVRPNYNVGAGLVDAPNAVSTV